MIISMTSIVFSLFYTILLGIIYFSKQHINNFENKIYENMVIANIIGMTIELIACIITYIGNYNYSLIIFLSRGMLVYFLTWEVLFTYYITIMSLETKEYPEKNKEKKYKKIKKTFIVFFIICLVLVCILPVSHFSDGINAYAYGIACDMLSLLGVIFIIYDFCCVVRNYKKISLKKYLPLFILFLLMIIMIVIRTINPSLLLLTSIFSFITFIMYFTIENPDLKMINELELAKQNADRANEAKTEFLSSMSHEIRTPLNAIVGFSNSILEDNTLEEAKTEAKDIIMASNNLLEIVNGILDISKIEAGKMEIVETEYNLLETLNNITKLIIPRIGEKPIELKTNFSKDIPAVLYGDMSKVREIITNLLTNAVKYTEKGIIELSVQCINTKNKSKLVISVEDTGRGIKPDKIDKLFTKFQRLEEDKNTTLEGTGLGLAITKSLVEMLGGKIVVQSKYGSGSKFTVYLEQKIIKMIEEKQPIEEIKDDEKQDYSNKKILIVDDNMLNIKVASRLLKNYQITPDSVLSGQECLDKVKETTYDLIFMDDMMPNMSGPETLQILKKDKNFKTPVVILTANAISGMKEKYLKNGFTDYLAKPIDKLELDRILKEYLKDNKNN